VSKISPVILVGGSGKRPWPPSRESTPEQFVPLLGREPTFQPTLRRVADRGLFGRPVIATNDAYRLMAEQQAKDIGIAIDLLIEASRRDSGLAMATKAVAKTRKAGGRTNAGSRRQRSAGPSSARGTPCSMSATPTPKATSPRGRSSSKTSYARSWPLQVARRDGFPATSRTAIVHPRPGIHPSGRDHDAIRKSNTRSSCCSARNASRVKRPMQPDLW
jgi:hypothetical protein